MRRACWATVGVLACIAILLIDSALRPPRAAAADTVGSLAGTSWRLVAFQSMDDAIGTVRPNDPALYTMRLDSDGSVTMRLNCNQAKGRWSAQPSSDPTSGRFEFGSLAATRAICPAPSMDKSIVAQAPYIRSYLLNNDRLYLSLMADAGIYAWEPDPGEASAAGVPAAPEAGEADGDPEFRTTR